MSWNAAAAFGVGGMLLLTYYPELEIDNVCCIAAG
jgi:hypothetical protein